MERDKKGLQTKRAVKVKALQVSDFIALGSKPTRGQAEATEPKTKPKSTILLVPRSSQQKDAPSSSATSTSGVPAKRSKLSSNVLGRSSSQTKKESKSQQWDAMAIETEANDLVSKVIEAEELSDDEKVEALLCGAVKKLKNSRAKPESQMYLGLLLLAKTKHLLFYSDIIVEAFCSILKRDISVNFKTKGNSLVSVLAANVLMAAYKDDSNWPDIFVKVFIEDSLGERVWVDQDHCKGFVDNILTAFNTKPIPKHMMAPERIFKPEACPSPPAIGTDDEETSCSSSNVEMQESQEGILVFPRFPYSEDSLAVHVIEVIREHMSRRQPMEISRNTLRFLVCTCGISEIRLTSAQKLEMWLQNPKMTRSAQELMLSVCINCDQHNQQDIEVISQLVKIRIKAKPIINHYLMCMKELLSQNPDNLGTLLKHAIYNELSNSRNPNNMQLIGIIFQHSSEKAAKVLANVFVELLLNKDDYLRALRALLREIVRTVRGELNFQAFCLEMMQECKESNMGELESTLKERIFLAVVDLVVLAIFLCITPHVKENFSAFCKGENKDLSHLRNFQMQVASIQRDAIWWLHMVVPKVFKSARNEFVHSIHKILFMEQMEHYYKIDNWPPDQERMLFFRLGSEVPLLEDTLMRIMIIGLTRELHLIPMDALELADQLVKRAAGIHCIGFSVLDYENPELCDVIFNLCAYHYPENISLPQGYHPPNLAISELYWKAWTMLLVIVAHNPSSFGEMAWKTYPMLRNMMEMCITSQFMFPPPTLATGEKADDLKNRELQMSQMEKDRILLFETHLAAASSKVTITEANSLLLSKLISMDPHGPARKPPIQVMDQLQAMNAKLKLGHLLCHSRNPDFLLDIIQRQGTSQSMPWLSELVESSADSFSVLPVQCLCEFLVNERGNSLQLNDFAEENREENKEKAAKKKKMMEQLLIHLQGLLHAENSDSNETTEIINYFMKRLSYAQANTRTLACRGLQMVLSQPTKSPMSDEIEMLEDRGMHADFDWLLKTIPALPHFPSVSSQISLSLRQACQIENEPATIAAYVTFLAANTPDRDLQDLADLALDMAQMIVERPTIVNTILPSEGSARNGHSNNFLSSISEIFFKYLSEAKSPSKEVFWSESQDQILIQWPNGEAATMHILVVHAMIIVLTYGPPHTSSKLCFEKLLDNWFPKNSDPPKAFLVDTSEEALLLPDWLKLRMIRSSVDVLVDAALKDLDPSQLVLFIQSFGIPVSSMSKLLKTLDLAVEIDSLAVEQSVLDKSYMSQLVEVQHKRGATGGDKFAKLLIDNSTDVIMEDSTIPAQTRVIQRAPPKVPTAIEVDYMSISLLKLFGLDTSSGILSAKQEHDLFKGLQKALTQDILSKSRECGSIGKFIETFEQVLRSDLNVIFLQALHRKSSYSSVLLRLATARMSKSDVRRSPLFKKLVFICNSIVHLGGGLKSPLLTVASQFFKKHKPQETKKAVAWKEYVKQKKGDILNGDSIVTTVKLAESHDPLRLEEVIQYLVKCSIMACDTKPLMSAMTSITLKRLTETNLTQNIKTFNRSKFCFFVDWLECLEPNIVTSFPQSQCQLLFSLITKQGKPVVVPFRPYLLALLIHQSSWTTLHYYINMILNPSVSDTRFDPSSVLDFLQACIDIPKIWQGKNKTCKREVEEDVLALTKDQMKAVIDYILEESMFYNNQDVTNTTESKSGPSLEASPIIKVRLSLFMKCLSNRRFLVYHSLQHLAQLITEKNKKESLAIELLLHMYLCIPSMLSYMPECVSFMSKTPILQKANYSKLDVICHTLLTSLADTKASKQCVDKMRDIDFICRKIASAHPVLLLRLLPMITTQLRGRVHFEYSVFRVRNHLTHFTCILGFLEILPPYLFKDEYTSSLHEILTLFMEVFQTYGPQKELISMMNRYFSLLLQYLQAKAPTARQFIVQYSSVLQDLSAAHPDLGSLRQLLAGACLHYWGAAAIAAQPLDSKSDSRIPDIITSTQLISPQSHIGSILARLSQGNMEEVAIALQELETVSVRKPLVLEHFVDNLKYLMTEGTASIRLSAFNLVMRLVKSNPKKGSSFLSMYLQCLESDNMDVLNTALEHLPEFVVLVQEHANVLLQKTFSVGMLKNINTAPRVRDTISLLIMQGGR